MQTSTFSRLFDFGYEDKTYENMLQRFYIYNHQISSFTEQYSKSSNSYHLHLNVDRAKITHSTDTIVIYYESHRLLYYTYYYLQHIAKLYEDKVKDYTYPVFTKDDLLDFEIACISDDEHLNNILDELYNVKNTIYHLSQLSKYNTDKYYSKEITKFQKLEDEYILKFNQIMTTTFSKFKYDIPKPIIPPHCLQLSNHFIVIQNFVPQDASDNIVIDYSSIPIHRIEPTKTNVVDVVTSDLNGITTQLQKLELNENETNENQSENESTSSVKSKSKLSGNETNENSNSSKLKLSKSSTSKTKISKPTAKKNEFTMAGLHKLTNTKLIEICKEYNYSPYTKKKKDELISLILSNSIYSE